MHHFALLSSLLLGIVPSSLSATFDVVVGGPGVLKFNPSFVNANTGDVVRFTFQQKNHTASQSTFDNPCSLNPGGFDTGFIPVADNATSFPVADLLISNINPIWVYCRQANHCQQGMVFAVNPGDKFSAFQAAAMAGGASTSTASSTVVTTPATSATVAVPSSTPGTDHRVVVGGPNILAYSPSNITAQVGDTITFEFHQKNHTVTASSFSTPCRALSLTSTTGDVGFDSGFMAVGDGTLTFPTYTIRVNDTNPIWAYCRQATHCGQGMVFSANAVESGPKNFSAFQALAKQQNGTTTTTTTTTTSDAQTAFKFSYVGGWIAVPYLISFLA